MQERITKIKNEDILKVAELERISHFQNWSFIDKRNWIEKYIKDLSKESILYLKSKGYNYDLDIHPFT